MIVSKWQEIQPYFNSLHELEIACFGISKWDEITWEMLFKNRALSVRLEFQDELLVGFAVVSMVLDEAELLRIAVRKDLRRKGLGRKLLEQSIQDTATLDCKTLFLEVRADNYGAVQLYERCGFKMVDRRVGYYANPVCDALLFSRAIIKTQVLHSD